MDEELHAAAELLVRDAAAVLDSIHHPVVAWSVAGRLVFVNEIACSTFLWERDRLVGTPVGERLVTPDYLPETLEIVRRVEAGETWSGDLMVLRGDGVVVRTAVNLSPLRACDGAVVGTIATAEDLSMQRVRERRANRTVNYLLQALAGGEVGTFNWDFESNTVSWDEVAASIYGVPPEHDIATFDEWMDLVDDHDREGVLESRQHAARTDQYYRATWRLALPGGELRWIDERGAAAVDPDGKVTGIVGVMADSTARLLYEQEVKSRAQEAHRLAAEQSEQRTRLEFFTTLDKLTLHANDHRDLMFQLADACVPFLADWCSIHFCAGGITNNADPEVVVAHRDPSKVDLLHALLVKHPPQSQLPVGAGAVIRTLQPQHLTDFGFFRELATRDEGHGWEDDARQFFENFDPVSLVALPMRTSSGVVGAVQFVTDMSSGRVYGQNDVMLLERTATRIAEALEVTWLRDEQRSIAATLQSALLPPRLRHIDGMDQAVRYWVAGAMSEVGGDFYDIYSLPDAEGGRRRWAVVIGDVCGTGPAAAAVTAIARHTVRAAARHGYGHSEVLEWLNQAILLSDRDRYCTIVYSTLIENGDGTWTFESVAGGHPLPILVGEDGRARALGRPGTLMGMLETVRSHPTATILQPGDTVMLYTDGFTDVPGSHGIEDDELYAMVERVSREAASADEFADLFGRAIEAILPMAERDDDMAMLVLRVDGRPGVEHDPVVLLGERTFPPLAASVGEARRFVDELIGQIATADSIVLGVSELATNAVIHARSDFVVRVLASNSVIRVEVADESPAMPVISDSGSDGAGGRGMRILDHLATTWGVDNHGRAKTVWFEVHGPQVRRVRRPRATGVSDERPDPSV